ncbi:amino acid ABC transporter permease [Alteribacillus bidgolensis]|uniref:Amino acid ABC transporter membrane protein, PAAT family n=1 Tax=Alteribacillus bidgolensis TaxID=930129 RepID=A0A1G8N0M6_9BACI|nr:amino acid ABC transporter permease [Alteribacillus bidgolensis]SDI73703.1 amino acid ABC transporter membrane protein, PAAT family [Alteribacillus bidgolensis]
MYVFTTNHYIEILPNLWSGFLFTLLITITGVAIGFVLGAIFGLMRLSKVKIVYGIATIYVELVRGTPLLVQIFFIYFGLSDFMNINLDKLTASIIAIAANAGAYIAEIVRGAVQSVDKGQTEAGRSLGLSSRQTMLYIIWPQALRRMIPPLGNQFIISLKDTSLFSAIAVTDLMYEGRQYASSTFADFESYIMVAIFYLVITIPSMLILRQYERRFERE